MPTNTTPETAMDLGSSATTITLDVSTAAGPNYDVWFKRLAQPRESMVGILAYGDYVGNYEPDLTVWTGDPSSLTQYLPIIQTFDTPAMIPITPGTWYYFRVRQGWPGTPDNPLKLRVTLGPNSYAGGKSIVIGDADPGFPAAVLNVQTGEIIRYLPAIEASDWGAQLPDGTTAFQVIRTGDKTHLVIYDPDFNAVADVASVFNTSTLYENVSTNRVDRFYSAKSNVGVNATVKAWTATGTLINTWTLGTSSRQLKGLGVSHDNAVLYYGSVVAGSNIYRWDLVGNVAMSDLVGDRGGSYSAGRVILVLNDGSVIATYNHPTAPDLRRYDASGTLLNTYSFAAEFAAGYVTIEHLAHDTDDDTTFWVWLQGSLRSAFRQIRVSDGAVLTTIDSIPIFLGGVYQDVPLTMDVAPTFGTSNSCPLLLLMVPAIPPTADLSEPCCPCDCPPPTKGGTPSATPLVTHTGPILDPIDPLSWTPECTGGGTVPTAADATDAESWVS